MKKIKIKTKIKIRIKKKTFQYSVLLSDSELIWRKNVWKGFLFFSHI